MRRRSTGRERDCEVEEGCITCGDVALELTRPWSIDEPRGLALCEDDRGRRETVEIALVAPVDAGDRLLVHAGTAISRITASPQGAARGDAVGEGSP